MDYDNFVQLLERAMRRRGARREAHLDEIKRAYQFLSESLEAHQDTKRELQDCRKRLHDLTKVVADLMREKKSLERELSAAGGAST